MALTSRLLPTSLDSGFPEQHTLLRPRCTEQSQLIVIQLVQRALRYARVGTVNLVFLFSYDRVGQVGCEADAGREGCGTLDI